MPLADMTGDWRVKISDALFARNLREAGHLLWLKDPALPDLAGGLAGGAGEDPAWAEADENPCLTFPGAYRSVCVSLKVRMMRHCGVMWRHSGRQRGWPCY